MRCPINLAYFKGSFAEARSVSGLTMGSAPPPPPPWGGVWAHIRVFFMELSDSGLLNGKWSVCSWPEPQVLGWAVCGFNLGITQFCERFH